MRDVLHAVDSTCSYVPRNVHRKYIHTKSFKHRKLEETLPAAHRRAAQVDVGGVAEAVVLHERGEGGAQDLVAPEPQLAAALQRKGPAGRFESSCPVNPARTSQPWAHFITCASLCIQG